MSIYGVPSTVFSPGHLCVHLVQMPGVWLCFGLEKMQNNFYELSLPTMQKIALFTPKMFPAQKTILGLCEFSNNKANYDKRKLEYIWNASVRRNTNLDVGLWVGIRFCQPIIHWQLHGVKIGKKTETSILQLQISEAWFTVLKVIHPMNNLLASNKWVSNRGVCQELIKTIYFPGYLWMRRVLKIPEHTRHQRRGESVLNLCSRLQKAMLFLNNSLRNKSSSYWPHYFVNYVKMHSFKSPSVWKIMRLERAGSFKELPFLSSAWVRTNRECHSIENSTWWFSPTGLASAFSVDLKFLSWQSWHFGKIDNFDAFGIFHLVEVFHCSILNIRCLTTETALNVRCFAGHRLKTVNGHLHWRGRLPQIDLSNVYWHYQPRRLKIWQHLFGGSGRSSVDKCLRPKLHEMQGPVDGLWCRLSW